MKTLVNILLCLSLVFTIEPVFSLPAPPPGKQWVLIDKLSDEFDNGFDTRKWIKNDPQWAGRKPALFKESQVTVQNGKLQITADILPPHERVNGWTHAGGLVRSLAKAPASYHGYFEARMKANKTFMSSTFWLINRRYEGGNCKRTTELDVTEAVGFNSGGHDWISRNMRRMNSNTHSRHVSCGEPTGRKGNNAELGGLASDRFHTYGVWWKTPSELVFYLDGVRKYTIKPRADFSLGMYLRMVVESYDWNPPPSGGGMYGSFEDRTTYYDWVRSYRLVDNGPPNPPAVKDVPGRLEAENYNRFSDATMGNEGGQYRNDDVDIQNTTDSGGGYNVGWIDAGEWLEYNINVTQSGNYKAAARVASVPGNGSFLLQVDGGSVGSTVNIPATGGWQNWISSDNSIGNLSTGNHTLRFQVQNGGFNLNWLDIRLDGTNPGPIDQCDTTQQCKDIFGDQATDCKNSASDRSVCMCGNSPC